MSGEISAEGFLVRADPAMAVLTEEEVNIFEAEFLRFYTMRSNEGGLADALREEIPHENLVKIQAKELHNKALIALEYKMKKLLLITILALRFGLPVIRVNDAPSLLLRVTFKLSQCGPAVSTCKILLGSYA